MKPQFEIEMQIHEEGASIHLVRRDDRGNVVEHLDAEIECYTGSKYLEPGEMMSKLCSFVRLLDDIPDIPGEDN